MFLVLDLIAAAVLLFFMVRGASKGLVLSLCGLLAILVAFAGASLTARTLSPAVGQALEPRLAAAIESHLDSQLQKPSIQGEAPTPGGEEDLPLQDALNALREMGFYEELVEAADRAIENGMTAAAAGAAARVAAAIAQSIAYRILFVLSFAVLLVLWGIFSRALDLVARLPGLHFLNKTGGAAIGLAKGLIVLLLAAWVLQSLGHVIPEETVKQTTLLRFLVDHNPLSALTGFAG